LLSYNGILSGIYEIVDGNFVLDDFAREALSLIYPVKIIKKVIYRPYAGHWFPYLDIVSWGHEMQQSFFYGDVAIHFSAERYCSMCGRLLDEFTYNPVPVSLCPNCYPRVYFGYWDCLYSIKYRAYKFLLKKLSGASLKGVNEVFISKVGNINEGTQAQICDDLLSPRCGFPLKADFIIPCLKNHGISLTFVDSSHLVLDIGSLDYLKYKMIKEGGIFGIIFGFKRRIIDLGCLYRLFSRFLFEVYSYIERYNFEQEEKKQADGFRLRFYQDEIKAIISRMNDDVKSDLKGSADSHNFINIWALLNYLRCFPNFGVKYFLRRYLGLALEFLEGLVKRLALKEGLDIIEFLPLYKYFTPFSSGIKKKFHDKFTSIFNLSRDKISEFSAELASQEFHDFHELANRFNFIKLIDLEAYNGDFEIYGCLGALGRYIIADSNIYPDPIFLNVDDLIGRQII